MSQVSKDADAGFFATDANFAVVAAEGSSYGDVDPGDDATADGAVAPCTQTPSHRLHHTDSHTNRLQHTWQHAPRR